MYFDDLLQKAYITASIPGEDEIVLLPAGLTPSIESSMVVKKSDFEAIMMEYRSSVPASEAVLVTIGKSGSVGSNVSFAPQVYDLLCKRSSVIDRYTALCNAETANKLESLENGSADPGVPEVGESSDGSGDEVSAPDSEIPIVGDGSAGDVIIGLPEEEDTGGTSSEFGQGDLDNFGQDDAGPVSAANTEVPSGIKFNIPGADGVHLYQDTVTAFPAYNPDSSPVGEDAEDLQEPPAEVPLDAEDVLGQDLSPEPEGFSGLDSFGQLPVQESSAGDTSSYNGAGGLGLPTGGVPEVEDLVGMQSTFEGGQEDPDVGVQSPSVGADSPMDGFDSCIDIPEGDAPSPVAVVTPPEHYSSPPNFELPPDNQDVHSEERQEIQQLFDTFFNVVKQYDFATIMQNMGTTPQDFSMGLTRRFPVLLDQLESSRNAHQGNWSAIALDLIDMLRLEAMSALDSGNLERAQQCSMPVYEFLYE